VSRTHTDSYLAYADGACRGNPGPGGWGAVIIAPDGAVEELNGADSSTTNNRMEITAAIEALRRIPRGARIVLRSDSQYVVNTMKLNWKRSANRDLWEQLDVETELREVSFEWVRGHSGEQFNERADRLANAAIDGKLVHRGAHAVPAHRAKPAARSESAREAEGAIDALLHRGETVRKCLGCGRGFVASSAAETYCSQVTCQIKARGA
jgi:ribonuclease HI